MRGALIDLARSVPARARRVVKRLVPAPLGDRAWKRARRLASGRLRFGLLWRKTPVGRVFGFDRGTPIDRRYIEEFLAGNAADVRDRVLEVGDSTYTSRFGGDRVTQHDVLHVEEGHAGASLVGDLSRPGTLPPDAFECILCTQTLQFVYEPRVAIANLHRALAPGGVLLATFPGISQISRYDMDRWGEFWRFTTLGARRLFSEAFPDEQVEVEARGNVLAAIAYLHGLAAEELTPAELGASDPDYELVVLVRAVKAVP